MSRLRAAAGFQEDREIYVAFDAMGGARYLKNAA